MHTTIQQQNPCINLFSVLLRSCSMSLRIHPHDIQPHDIQPHDIQPHDIQPHDIQPHDITAAWHSAAWHSAAWHSAAWHSAAWHSAAWHSAAWHSAAWHSAAWHSAAWHSAAWHSAAWHSAAWPDYKFSLSYSTSIVLEMGCFGCSVAIARGGPWPYQIEFKSFQVSLTSKCKATTLVLCVTMTAWFDTKIVWCGF